MAARRFVIVESSLCWLKQAKPVELGWPGIESTLSNQQTVSAISTGGYDAGNFQMLHQVIWTYSSIGSDPRWMGILHFKCDFDTVVFYFYYFSLNVSRASLA